MKIVFFEFKKIMFKPILLILLVVFSVIDVYLLTVNARDYAPFSSMESAEKLYNDCCEKVEGKITNEKISFVIDKYNETAAKISGDFFTDYDTSNSYTGYLQSDFNVFLELYSGIKRVYQYSENTEKAIEKAKENIEFFSESGNAAQVKKYEDMISVYEGRKVDSFYRTDGFEAYFGHNFSSLIALLMILFTLSGAFSSEREIGMTSLIFTSKRGVNGIIWPRLAASFLICAFLVAWFTLVDIATVAVTNGLYGWENPLYSLPSYTYTTVNYSIGTHVILSALLKVAGLCSVSFCIISISSLSPSTLVSFSANITLIIMLILLDDRARFGGSKVLSAFFNPISLFTLQDVSKLYTTVEFFGQSITAFAAEICVGLAVFALLFVFSALIMRLSSRKVWRGTR